MVQGAHGPDARRGAFSSVPALIDAMELWIEHRNDDPMPFVSHAEADKIIGNARRGNIALTAVKYPTHDEATDAPQRPAV